MAPEASFSDHTSKQPEPRISANPGYAADQMVRALRALNLEGTAADRAGQRVSTWWSVMKGMLSGSINVGSRTPLADTPAWATPQVFTGGFATGRLMISIKYDD